eukprot:1949024-Rhodomonas_salina.1
MLLRRSTPSLQSTLWGSSKHALVCGFTKEQTVSPGESEAACSEPLMHPSNIRGLASWEVTISSMVRPSSWPRRTISAWHEQSWVRHTGTQSPHATVSNAYRLLRFEPFRRLCGRT